MRQGPLTREYGLLPDDSLPVSEDDLRLYRVIRDNMGHPNLPVEFADRVFEPVRVLGDRLAHLHHPRSCRLDIRLVNRCYGRAMFVAIEDGWENLGPMLRESGPEAFISEFDADFKVWLPESMKLLELANFQAFRWPPRDRAEALGLIRLAIPAFWAAPESFLAGIRTGLQAKAGDVGLSTAQAAAQLRADPGSPGAFVHLFPQSGRSLTSCAFVDKEGHVRLGWRQVRDKVPVDVVREILLPFEKVMSSGQEDGATTTLQLEQSTESDPLDALEAIDAARHAADLRQTIEEVARERAARGKPGSLRSLVLQHATSLLSGEVGISELARRAKKSRSGLSEAWGRERAAIRNDPRVRALAG